MAHDVFISHSHEDKPAADAACAALEARGIRCWIAPRDIAPGQDWAASIVAAIQGAQIMLLVFSQHANQSPQVKREVERAANSGKVILPLRVDDVLPEAALAYYLGTPHWLDAITKPFEAHLEKLADACESLLAVTGRSPQDEASPVTGSQPPTRGSVSTSAAPTEHRAPSSSPAPPVGTSTPPTSGPTSWTTKISSRTKIWAAVALAVVAVLIVVAVTLHFGNNGGAPASHPAYSPPPATPTPALDPDSASLQQLQQLAAVDHEYVRDQLAGHWIPVLSSLSPAVVQFGVKYDNTQILQKHLRLRSEYDAKLLWSGDWSSFDVSNLWVTVVPVTFSDSASALAWCKKQNLDADNCVAEVVSTTRSGGASTAHN
jgi:hypothetical protein